MEQYYAVIFSSVLNPNAPGYEETADAMVELAAQQPGYIGMESYRNSDGAGVTVSYWRDLESIRNWKKVEDHLAAQHKGRTEWYKAYRVRICRLEREYAFGDL